MQTEVDELKWWHSNYPILIYESIKFENILSIRVLEWLVVVVGCEIKSINELEVRARRRAILKCV